MAHYVTVTDLAGARFFADVGALVEQLKEQGTVVGGIPLRSADVYFNFAASKKDDFQKYVEGLKVDEKVKQEEAAETIGEAGADD